MKTINNVKITPLPPSPPPEVGLGDSNFCEGVSNINMSKTLASNNEKRWIWKNLPPHPLEGGGVRPQNFSKILLRGKKQLTKNFKSIGTLIQKLLIFGAFLAKMFHSALGKPTLEGHSKKEGILFGEKKRKVLGYVRQRSQIIM